MRLQLLFIVLTLTTSSLVQSDLIISKLDRKIDLTSQIVRALTTLKVQNDGSEAVSEVLIVFPEYQAKNLVHLESSQNEGKRKSKVLSTNLLVKEVHREGMPPALKFFAISLFKGLGTGESITLDVLAVFTHSLQPFPEEITQADTQLVIFQDTGYYLSPYEIKAQSLTVRLPSPRVETFTQIEITKLVESEIKYGPFENLPPFSYKPIIVHYENNRPFAVAEELVREIEISHWGNVQVTEHYKIIHGGAQNKGGFSRLDYQSRHVSGASSFRRLVARFPPRAHSVYYRDEIGNISTSHLYSDSRKTELEIEPRYPMFGGWRTAFTIGYGLPLKDYLFGSAGKRFINISFGCPMDDIVIDNLIVKVVLPEGSTDVSVSVPFPVNQREELKFSHLDIVGRPVVVLEKRNVIPEHNLHFQVYYKFSNLSLLREPLMLISGFLFLFITSILYMHADMSISKSSASYLAKLHWDEVLATIQQFLSIINRCLSVHDKLEASLHDLSRTGDVQTCKATRKASDVMLKELSKDLKPLLSFLQNSPQAAQIWPKVEELIAKEKETEEKLMLKIAMVVESYEKKSGGKELENRIAALQQKIASLKSEIDELIDIVGEI